MCVYIRISAGISTSESIFFPNIGIGYLSSSISLAVMLCIPDKRIDKRKEIKCLCSDINAFGFTVKIVNQSCSDTSSKMSKCRDSFADITLHIQMNIRKNV